MTRDRDRDRDRPGADTAAAVRAYYDSNTGLFLRMGIGRQTLAIRRAVWADNVTSLEEAVNYVNGLVAAEAARAARTTGTGIRVLDIGCGVGGSLFFLADSARAPLRGIGITVSPVQAATARREARVRGLSARCSFVSGDFTQAAGLPVFHLAFAIESFVHFASPAAFFSAAAARLAPGSRLVVVDDFLSGSRKMQTPAERRIVEAFRHGWLLSSLCTAERAARAAGELGLRLVEDRDLSRFLAPLPLGERMGRWAVRVMRALPVPWLYWRSSVGSLAQAACRRAGLIEYRFLVFEKAEPGRARA